MMRLPAGERSTWVWQTAPAAAGLIVLLFCRRAWHALWFMPFVDETEHIIGGRVLRAGGFLYRDFVEQHGPLPYALGELSSYVPHFAQPGAARLLMLALMAAATAAVAASPCLRGWWERCCAAALFVGLTGSLWIVQALCMLDYQPVTGMLLVIGCAQSTFCAWCRAPVHRAGLAVAGAAFALVPFAAYSYAPATILLTASLLAAFARRGAARDLLPFAAGAAASVAVMGTWMLLKCDLVGYFVYHIIFNQLYVASYIHFSLTNLPGGFVPHFTPGLIVQAIATLVAVSGFLVLALRGGGVRHVVVVGIGLLGVVMSNPRANPGFQNGAFVLLAFGMAGVGLPRLPRALGLPDGGVVRAGGAVAMICVVAAAEGAARTALSSPHGFTRAEITALPRISLVQSDAPWARRLRRIVAPDEPILVLAFQPNVYIEAGRLPMPGFDHYFPWDTDYARHPWFGRGRDICAAIRRAPPAVIYDTDWVVWGRYAPQDYMPCVAALRAELYEQVETEPPIYVRKDRAAAWRVALPNKMGSGAYGPSGVQGQSPWPS